MAPIHKSLILLVFLLLFLSGTGAAIPEEKLKEVRAKHEKALFELGDVSAVSHDETTGEIIVYVEKPEHEKKIPKKLDDIPVRVEVIGKIYALKPAVAAPSTISCSYLPCIRTAQFPFLIGGISVGNAQYSTSAGTIGVVVKKYDQNGWHPAILSNAHVLALNANAKFITKGTPICQPGGYDNAGQCTNIVGSLEQYISIKFNTFFANNYADAAIASLNRDTSFSLGTILNQDNLTTSHITGGATVTRGTFIKKSGRTTGVTTGTVQNSMATVLVYYTKDQSRYAYFKDQILASPMSQGGDSGSAVWVTYGTTNYFVGLLFAGSDQISIICKDKYIKSGLGITID